MKKKILDLYMGFAEDVANLSHARRLKVGSVIVKDDRIISYGYNGTSPGSDNNCENEIVDEIGSPILTTKAEVIHSEMNAIGKLARSHESGHDAIMVMTRSPCIECAKAIGVAGISKLIYKDEYRSTDGIDYLRKNGVDVMKYQ